LHIPAFGFDAAAILLPTLFVQCRKRMNLKTKIEIDAQRIAAGACHCLSKSDAMACLIRQLIDLNYFATPLGPCCPIRNVLLRAP
jgi:hypothetical protein